jgi:anti-anti-sigma factor
MELTVVSDDGRVLRLQAEGRIAQDDPPPPSDTMTELLGAEVYARKAVLSLENVEFIDTGGMGWLLARHKRFRKAGGKLVIHSASPIVIQVLKMLHLHQVFLLADDEPGAVALLASDD